MRPVAILAVLAACGSGSSRPPEVTPRPPVDAAAPALRWLGSEVRFATADEAAAVLGADDAFSSTMSDFDRGLRMKTSDPVNESTYLAFAAGEATAWPAEARAKASAVADQLGRALDGLALALPPEILLVRSSGEEELGAPHTRGHAIVLPASFDDELGLHLLAHELFHVATRHDPSLRDRTFAALGFRALGRDLDLPAALEDRRITNPDGFSRGHAIAVTHQGREVEVVPVLASSAPLAETLAAASPLAMIEIWLLPVDGGAPIAMADTDYAARVGKNTGYIIHPEEATAENVALMLLRRAGDQPPIADPAVLDALLATLQR